MRFGRERRIERRLHERLDLESRFDHPHDERTERKTMGDYRNTFPRRVLARTFRTVRGRYGVSIPVPFQAAVHRVLTAGEKRTSRAKIPRDELHRGPKVRRPTDSVDREHEIKVTGRNPRIHFHWGLDEPNGRSTREERLFRERNLNGRQIDAPELSRAGLGKITERVAAPSAEFQRTEIGGAVQQPE